MAKVIFIPQRKPGTTREACLKCWEGEQHTAIVRTISGLAKWVQNHVIATLGEPACDGVGELWFESDEAMQSALNSPAMATAVEDAKNFLDMDKTSLVIVEEKTIIGVARWGSAHHERAVLPPIQKSVLAVGRPVK